ncbi:MAG: hypothetical protein GY838_11045 [bacterium]|nr:hypothetical protein [bacterium]
MRAFASIALILILTALPVVAAVQWSATETVEDGIPVVTNPGTSRDGESVLAAREAWRFGADEENDPLLGLITDVIADADGNTFLLDGNLSLIHVMDPAGVLLRTIGREGDGPGEFRNATELAFMPDGDVGIMEMMPGNVVVMDRHGEPRDSFRPGGDANGDGGRDMMLPQHMDTDDHGIVLGHVSTSFGQDGVVTSYTLARYGADGSLAATLVEHNETQDGGNISLSLGGGDDDFTRNWTLCDDGSVVVFRHAFDYELQVFGRDGSPVRTIRRDYETRKRSERALASARRQAEEMNARFPGVTQEVEERARDITAIHARPDGFLWVENSAGNQARPEGSLGAFDVFDTAGRYVRTLRIEGVVYDPARDDYSIVGDRLFVFREARMVPPKQTTSGGGGMMMVMVSGGAPDPEDETESGPLEIVCYDLGD